MTFPTLSPRELVAGLVVLAMIFIGYLSLVLTDHDADGFVAFVVTVAGLAGLGGHQVKQSRALATISEQTNGVLTQRIEAGARKAIRDELDRRAELEASAE